VDIILVWVHIQGLSFILQSEEVLGKNGNTLSNFYELDLYFQETRYYDMDRILVGLKVRKGMIELMDIRRGFYLFRLNMDYEGIPFICVSFHYYGNLVS